MTGNRKIKILAAATLIRRFHERCPCEEIYDKAIRCYEILIDSIQNPSSADEISKLLDIPAVKIKAYAGDIINILLFNQENDPYLSFGLMRHASLREVNVRWKSLIFLYHPDKYSDKGILEEKAKKINEIRNKIQTLQEQKIYLNSSSNISAMPLPQRSKISDLRYLKCLPFVIIGIAVLMAIFSILLLIFGQVLTRPGISSDGGKEKGYGIVRSDRNIAVRK